MTKSFDFDIAHPMQIRKTEESDLVQVNDIYNWYTENGFSTFGMVIDIEKRKEWFKQFSISPKHTSFVAEADHRVIGVACSFAYRGGGVFEDTLETSIYVHPSWNGKGVGSKLYERLFDYLKDKGVHRVVVGIALPNEGSVAIHKKFSFTEIGIFDEYAFYKGQYRSSIWMQKKMT